MGKDNYKALEQKISYLENEVEYWAKLVTESAERTEQLEKALYAEVGKLNDLGIGAERASMELFKASTARQDKFAPGSAWHREAEESAQRAVSTAQAEQEPEVIYCTVCGPVDRQHNKVSDVATQDCCCNTLNAFYTHPKGSIGCKYALRKE